MNVPEDFRVGPPLSFDELVTAGGADSASGTDPRVGGVWVEVSGGGLPVPLAVRIDRTADGRLIVTGLLVGRDQHREIDWATLRAIKPASIISMIFAGFDPKSPEKLLEDRWRTEKAAYDVRNPTAQELHAAKGWGGLDIEDLMVPPPEGTPRAAAANQATADLDRARHASEIWELTDPASSDGERPAATPVTRARASVATNLSDFAETYRRLFAADPRRATTATANELHISRATAIRRIQECRDLGLIPPKEKP